MPDRKRRSIAKAVSWRILATLITILIVFVFTGRLILSLGVGGVEIITKMAFYFVHERVWNKVKWGLRD